MSNEEHSATPLEKLSLVELLKQRKSMESLAVSGFFNERAFDALVKVIEGKQAALEASSPPPPGSGSVE